MGRPEKGLRRLAQDAQAANTRGDRQQRRDHAHGELLHHAAEHPGRAANHLPRLQSWVAVSISRAVCAARHAVPEGLNTSRMRGTKNMKEKQIKLPGPGHRISIQRNPARVVVSVAGRVVADTRNALTLREASYPPVQYIPGEDVDFSQLERSDHATYCPYKGDCSYYTIPAGGKKSVKAVWSY